jgi:transketolase C-terminal domain/subunit
LSEAVTLIHTGVTVHECLLADDQLEQAPSARFIDPYSIKPADVRTRRRRGASQDRVVAEDHHRRAGSARPWRRPARLWSFGSRTRRT